MGIVGCFRSGSGSEDDASRLRAGYTVACWGKAAVFIITFVHFNAIVVVASYQEPFTVRCQVKVARIFAGGSVAERYKFPAVGSVNFEDRNAVAVETVGGIYPSAARRNMYVGTSSHVAGV